ncbi:MAG: hypothetical protein O3A95_05525 [Planctomycetota bacterium]|nr:hypothetical protein [Planctomycetota bacterium]MDA1113746.1 hypothetical protein [Planctomycetota bacterium]
MKYLLLLLLTLPVVSMSCSLSPDTGWDDGNPFAKVRLLFDS